ncbi:MAG TPA: nucleotidyltransferase family protein [Spirochaetaceae bacterium]|nr:nucleotidyltransferase family protein [Spirochaetaceae bacterium]
MKCVILAAGYATRMYPLTKDLPKSLLVVADKTILEHILMKVEEVPEIDEIILVSNARFADQFEAYIKGIRQDTRICMINDGTWDNETRMGAIGDMNLAIRQKNITEDLMVLAGDNLFDFSLMDFAAYFHSVNADCITTHWEERLDALKKTGVAELDAQGKVLSFEEKPAFPKSNFAVPPFYIYNKETLPFISTYIEEGNSPDAPGQFVGWLVNKRPVYAFRFTGKRHDIGSLDSYREARRLFG